MKTKRTAVALAVVCLLARGIRAEEEAPVSTHYMLAIVAAAVATVHQDRALKYEERSARSWAAGLDGGAEATKAKRMKFRAGLFAFAAGCFAVSGTIRLVMADGLVGVRKEYRF